MVLGAGCFAFMWMQQIACWVYMIGACCFGGMQMIQTYDGESMAVRRLKKIMTLADLFFILSGMLMVEDTYRLLQPLFTSYVTYIELVFNKWVLLLLIAAVLELYTMHRISAELKKE